MAEMTPPAGPAPDPQERLRLKAEQFLSDWKFHQGQFAMRAEIAELMAHFAAGLASDLAAVRAQLEEVLAVAKQDNTNLQMMIEQVQLHKSALSEAEADLTALRAERDELASVCACGCPVGEHENYGEDGEACENEDHQCVRTSAVVADMLEILRAELAEARARINELEDSMNPSDIPHE